MSTLWNAPIEIVAMINEIKAAHHPHLAAASIWALCSDAKPVRDNRIIPYVTQKATKAEKLATEHDFKITVLMDAWNILTDDQRRIAIDEALCRCGVKYEPKTVVVNGIEEVVKDDLGRTIYTSDIQIGDDGLPKWKINKPDAGIFFAMVRRHGNYCEALEDLQRVRDGKPLPEHYGPGLFDDTEDHNGTDAADAA